MRSFHAGRHVPAPLVPVGGRRLLVIGIVPSLFLTQSGCASSAEPADASEAAVGVEVTAEAREAERTERENAADNKAMAENALRFTQEKTLSGTASASGPVARTVIYTVGG